MIGVLLRFVFFTINTILNLVSRALFFFIAEFVVVLVNTCRVPGEATKGILDQVGEFIKSVVTFLVEVVVEVITAVIYKALELIRDAVVEMVGSTCGSLSHLLEKTRESLQGAVSDVPEAMEGLTEMVTTLVSDLGNNYMEAVAYVWENVFA